MDGFAIRDEQWYVLKRQYPGEMSKKGVFPNKGGDVSALTQVSQGNGLNLRLSFHGWLEKFAGKSADLLAIGCSRLRKKHERNALFKRRFHPLRHLQSGVTIAAADEKRPYAFEDRAQERPGTDFMLCNEDKIVFGRKSQNVNP